MKSLKEIYGNHSYPEGNGDKGTAHTYIEIYEEVLKPYRNNGNILEIGISWGYSLRMWREYFINGSVTGIDVEMLPQAQDLLHNSNYNIIHHDATIPSILNHIGNARYDVIIDDGSHYFPHQIQSFNILKECLNTGGIYIIEDIDDIDTNINSFKELHESCKIIDNRHINNRWDDVLAIYYL